MTNSDGARFEFDVFISYSRTDIQLARVLHAALERFQIPSRAPEVRRIVVFRDETDIHGVRYYDSIDRLLRTSRKLLLICSPAARRSEFVNDELRRFSESNSLNNVVPVIARGRPNNEAASDELKAFPDLLGDMPLAADLSSFEPRRHRVQDPEWSAAWHLILANLLNLGRDVFAELLDAQAELARAEAIRLAELANIRKSQGRTAEALLHMAAAHALAPSSSLKENLGLATRMLFPITVVSKVLALPEPPRSLCFDADFNRVATWSDNGRVRILDLASGKEIATCLHDDAVFGGLFLRDGSLVTYARGGYVSILRPNADPLPWRAPFNVTRVVEAPDGDLLILLGPDGDTCLWDRRRFLPVAMVTAFSKGRQPHILFSENGDVIHATDGSVLVQLRRSGEGIRIDLDRDYKVHQALPVMGSFLASDGQDILLLLSDVESKQVVGLYAAEQAPNVVTAKVSSDMRRLCWISEDMLHTRDWGVWIEPRDAEYAHDDGRMSVHIGEGLNELEFWNGHAVAIAYGGDGACAVAADGSRLWESRFSRRSALAGVQLHSSLGLLSQVDFKLGHVTALHLGTGVPIEERRAVRPITAVQHSQAGAVIAVASGESALRMSSVRRRQVDLASRRYYDVAHVIDRDDRVLLVFGQQDGSQRTLDAVSGTQVFPPLTADEGAWVAHVTKDGRMAFTLGGARRLRAWRGRESADAADEVPLSLPGVDGPIGLTSSGDLVAVADGGEVVLVPLTESAIAARRLIHDRKERVMLLQLSPDGDFLVSVSYKLVRVWETRSGKAIGAPLQFRAPVLGAAFTTGARQMVAWCWDNSLVILDIQSGEAIWRKHAGPETVMDAGIKDVKISADGALLFTAGPDRSLRTWDTATGDEVAEPLVHPFPIAGIAPSDAAERIATWGADMVSVWNPWSGAKVGPDIEVAGIVSSAFWTTSNRGLAVTDESSLDLFDPEIGLHIAGPWRHGNERLSARFLAGSLVTWTESGMASVWGIETGTSVTDWRAASECVTGMMLDLDRRILSPLSPDEHARLDAASTRVALEEVYCTDAKPRAQSLSGFPSGRPLTEEVVRHYLVGEKLFDMRLNPVGRSPLHGPRDAYAASAQEASVLVQHAEGLMWQTGSSDNMRFDRAAAYVESTNATRYAGFADWRLPRLHEVAATLSAELCGSQHIVRGLSGQDVIWTSDPMDEAHVWAVHYGLGRLTPSLPHSEHAVRLVRTCGYDSLSSCATPPTSAEDRTAKRS